MFSTKKMKLCYMLSALLLTVFSGTFLAMPLPYIISDEYTRMAAVLIGSVFWVSCIAGYTLLFVLNHFDQKMSKNKQKKDKLFSFPNTPTMVADLLFAMGVIVFVILLRSKFRTHYIVYVNLFAVVLSLNLHLLFSRNMYKKIKNPAKYYEEGK